MLARVALVWSETIPGMKRAYGPGPALGISRLESSVGGGPSRDGRWQLRWPSGTASHTVRVGHPMGQDDVWHAHAAKEHALRQPPCPDHLLDPGLGANWPHCQVR